MTGDTPPADDSPLEEPTNDTVDEQVEQLRAENRALRERLEELEDLVKEDRSEATPEERSELPGGEREPTDDPGSSTAQGALDRRSALAGLAALGGLGLGAGHVGAAGDADALQEGTTMEYGGSYSGSTSSGHGLQLETPEKALIGKATDTSGFKFGVIGRSAAEKGRGIGGYADATSGANFGVLGRTASTEGGGVFGFTGPDTGNVKGVLGVTASPDGTGTLGFNNATSGSPAEGVRGETKSDAGVGVRGTATYTDAAAETYGVKGVSQTDADAGSDLHPTGVYGQATGTGEAYGVRGEASSGSGFGLYTPDNAKVDQTLQFTADSPPDIMMFESGTSNPDQNVISHSPSYPGYGLAYADTGDAFYFQAGGTETARVDLDTGDIDTNGDVTADSNITSNSGNIEASGGHVEANQGFRGNVGASVHPSSSQTIAGDFSFERIKHDNVIQDDRNEFDTTNNEFVCQYDGDYRVDAAASWVSSFSAGTEVQLNVEVSGSSESVLTLEENPSSGGSASIQPSVSKILKGLSAGDAIYAEIRHDDSVGSNDVKEFSNTTYLTVTQVA